MELPEAADVDEVTLKLLAKENADRLALLEMLPLEVWSMVFDRVKDDETMERLSNSSPYFRTLLSTERTKFLFPKVLNLVQSRLVRSSGTSEPRLNCRLVCKTWNKAIDNLCEEECCSGATWNFTKYFTTWEKAADFVSHFRDTHASGAETKSPLLGRSAWFDVTHGNSLAAVEGLVQTYGKHIWDLKLSSKFRRPFRVPYYVSMYNWLSGMPNLKRLKLCFSSINSLDNDALLPFLDQNHLQTFEKLHTLELEDVPSPIINMLIANNPGIVKLKVGLLENPVSINVDNFVKLNLKDLEFHVRGEEDAQVLENLATRGSGELSSLKIVTYPHAGSGFRILNRLSSKSWSDSVESLFIKFSWIDREFDYIQGVCKDFTKLKHVSIKLRNFVCFDFLLSLKNTLELLNIDILYVLDKECNVDLLLKVEKGQKIRLVGRAHALASSNIWKLFPRLKRIDYLTNCISIDFQQNSVLPSWLKRNEVTKRFCTRGQYEAFKRVKGNPQI